MGHFNEINLPMEEIIRDYLAGATASKLSIKHGCTCHTILKRLRKAGVITRKHAESYSVLSEQDRINMTAAAHAAKRGKPAKEESKTTNAETVERKALSGIGISILERRFIECLLETRDDIDFTPQKATGIYNIDVALTGSSVAVEIFGGHWHAVGKHAARYRPRIEYLLGAGWLPLIIWVTEIYPLSQAAVDYAISLHDARRAQHSFTSEEHVIWGTGELIPVDQRDPMTGARIRRFHDYNKSRGNDGRFRK